MTTITCLECGMESSSDRALFCPYCGSNLHPTTIFSGRAGPTASYHLDLNGNMHIEGSGSLYRISPWESFKNLIHTLTVKEGITHVSGFFECANLESVSLPESILVIEDYAFREAVSLHEIQIRSKKILLVGKSAFSMTPIADVWYEGTSKAWERAVFIEDGNEPFLLADMHFDESADPPTLCFNATEIARLRHISNALRSIDAMFELFERNEEAHTQWTCPKCNNSMFEDVAEAHFCPNCGFQRQIN